MRTTLVDRLAHVARGLLLLGALLALAVLGLWTLGQERVEAFGLELTDAHIAAPRALDVRLAALEPNDSEAFIELAEELAESLEGIRPGERLEVERRRALEYLTRHRERLGDRAGALEAARAWVGFDPRNVRAELELARLMGGDPELRDERLEVLGALFARLPEVGEVAGAWCELLMDEGRFAEAAAAALRADQQPRPNYWRVRWKRRAEASAPFQAMVFPELDAEGRLVVECEIGGPALWISIELPPGGSYTLVDPVLTITKKGSSTELPLADFEGVELVQLRRTGRSFEQTGGLGARFEIAPGPAALGGVLTLRFQAGLEIPPSAGLVAVAYHPRADEAFAALAASADSSDEDVLAVFRRARLTSLMRSDAQLYWRKRKGGFTRANSVLLPLGGAIVEGELRFEVEFPIAERVSLVRLDLPEALGVSYSFTALEVLGAAGVEALDPASIETELLHGLERAGATFTVTGKDPWLAFELPGPVETIEGLRLRGVAR